MELRLVVKPDHRVEVLLLPHAGHRLVHSCSDVRADLSEAADMGIKPWLGLRPDLAVARLAQLGEDEAAEQSVQVTLTLLRIPGHLGLDLREQLELELGPGVEELLVRDDDRDLGELLRDVVPDDVTVLRLVGPQQPQPVNCLGLAGCYLTEKGLNNLDNHSRELSPHLKRSSMILSLSIEPRALSLTASHSLARSSLLL